MSRKQIEKYGIVYQAVDGKHVEYCRLYGNQKLMDMDAYDISPRDPKNGDIIDVIGNNGEKTKARYEDARQ